MNLDLIKKTFERFRIEMSTIGSTILDVYENMSEGDVKIKGDRSPVTRADKLANEIIMQILEEEAPTIPVISEENKQIDFETRRHWDDCWLVDPLDGTKEFINRNGEFTVNVAYIHRHEVIAGVVYVPVTGAYFEAIKGLGAWEFKQDTMVQLHTNTFDPSRQGIRAVCSRSHLSEATRSFLERYKEPELVQKGSSLKFIAIAKNEADVYPRLGPTMEWDTGAAHIILEEAGGSVRQEDGTRLKYNKENLLNPFFIASANAAHG